MKYNYDFGLENLIYLAKICDIGTMIRIFNVFIIVSNLIRIDSYKSKKNGTKKGEHIQNGSNDIKNINFMVMRFKIGISFGILSMFTIIGNFQSKNYSKSKKKGINKLAYIKNGNTKIHSLKVMHLNKGNSLFKNKIDDIYYVLD